MIEAYSDDQRRSSHPLSRVPTSAPMPQLVLGELVSEVGMGVYKWKRRAKDSSGPNFRGPLGGKATELNLTTGINVTPPNNKIVVFADSKRWWFQLDGALQSFAGAGLASADFTHTFNGSEATAYDGANQNMIYIGPAPITGEFYFWGACVKTQVTLADGGTTGWAPPATYPYFQFGSAPPGATNHMNDDATAIIFCTGKGDTVTFSGVVAPSYTNGRGLEEINNIIPNGYLGGIPDSGGSTHQRHIWMALLDQVGNHSGDNYPNPAMGQVNAGKIHGRIWFWQPPTTLPDVTP